MAFVVSLFGVLIAAIGLVGVVQPSRLVRTLADWGAQKRLGVAVAVRLVMGVVLLIAAPSCRLPEVVRVVGVIALVAALVLPLLGSKRFEAFVGWWFARPPGFIRGWSLVAVAFGALLLYSGA
jgi:hypothetical protein